MKKIKILGIITAIFLLCGCSKNTRTNLEHINYQDYEKLINNKESFILEVMRTGCSACEALEPKLEEITEKYNINIKVIDTSKISKEDYDKLDSATNVSGTPTIIFYTKGEEKTTATRIIGSVTRDKLINKFTDMGYIKD